MRATIVNAAGDPGGRGMIAVSSAGRTDRRCPPTGFRAGVGQPEFCLYLAGPVQPPPAGELVWEYRAGDSWQPAVTRSADGSLHAGFDLHGTLRDNLLSLRVAPGALLRQLGGLLSALPGPAKRALRTAEGALSGRREPPATPGTEQVAALLWPDRPWRKENTELYLTLDVDRASALANLPRVAADLERAGWRATAFVPLALWRKAGATAPRSPALEYAVHGDAHCPGGSRGPLAAALAAAPPELIRGYRAPYLWLDPPALAALAAGGYAYDSSLAAAGFSTGAYAVPGNGFPWPFRVDGLLEMPVTMPLDSTLIFSGADDVAIIAAWRAALLALRARGALLLMAVHPDNHLLCRPGLYELWLNFLHREQREHGLAVRALADGMPQWKSS